MDKIQVRKTKLKKKKTGIVMFFFIYHQLSQEETDCSVFWA